MRDPLRPPISEACAGTCDTGFGAVREAFVQNFVEHDEIGASFCLRVDGQIVVDLWGGHQDAERTREWRRETLTNVYSQGKGVLAGLVALLVDRGKLDYDATVASYWPEFAAAGKGDITLRALLAHRAGMPALRDPLPPDAMLDWPRICTALAAQSPYWEPDTRHGYHVNTFGFLVGEVVRRVTGMRVGDALRHYITEPLGAAFYWGLPPELHSAVATTCAVDAEIDIASVGDLSAAFPPTGDADYDEMIRCTYFNPAGFSGSGFVNTPGWRSAEIPSTNGHANADAVSAIYSGLIGTGREPLVSESVLREATRVHSEGEDYVLRKQSTYGLGFQRSEPVRPFGPNPGTFGHYGYGGSLGFADPDRGLAFGYVMNRPGSRWQVPRTRALIEAVYGSLDAS